MSEPTTIAFTVNALPVAQPRPRAATRNGHATVYEAKKSHAIHDFKASVRLAATQAYQGPPLKGPLEASLLFMFPSKAKRRKPKDTRPDCDNLAKGVLDCLNKLVYSDDGQIVRLSVQKWHANNVEQPRVEVVLSKLHCE